MVDNNMELIDSMIRKSLQQGKVSLKEKELILRTLASKKHIQNDNKYKARRELIEAEEALFETSFLVARINKLEVV